MQTKLDTKCPACGTVFGLPLPVDHRLHVWCDKCWHAMTEEEKHAAVDAVRESEVSPPITVS